MKAALLCLLFSTPLFALSEQDVIRSVLTHFPLIQEAELKEQSSGGEVTAAEGAFDHKLKFKSRNRIEDKYDNQYFESSIERQTSFLGTSLFVGHRQGLGHFPAYDGKYRTSGAGELFAGISAPLLRNLKTDEGRTNLKLKQIEKSQAELESDLKKMIYLHKALSLYYKWILETKKLKINQDLLELAVRRHEMIERKYQAGDIAKIRVTDNQRAIDKRRSEILKNEIELNKVRTELGLYLRNADGSPLLISTEANPEFVLQKGETDLISVDVARTPQVQLLNLEMEKLKLESAYYEQSQLPGLNLDLLGAKELAPNDPYDPERLQVGVRFDFPLENRKAEGKNAAYKFKLQAFEKRKMFLEAELSQQLSFFLKASEDSKQRWETTSKEFAGSKLMAEAEKKRWSQGASDLFVINLREQDVSDVEIRRWTALYDYHQYHLDARLFSGNLLERK